MSDQRSDNSERRFWKLYRDERRKLVKAADPKCKRPFAVVLTSPQIVHVARTARTRLDA